ATSPGWRTTVGDERLFALITAQLAEAPKDRSCDHLMWAVTEHPLFEEMRSTCALLSVPQRLGLIGNEKLTVTERAVAAWFCSGIDYPYQNRVGRGDLNALGDLYRRIGVPIALSSASVLAARRTRQPYAVLVPLVWLEIQRSKEKSVTTLEVPPSGIA